MAMGISKGLSFVCLVAIFISLLFIKVADADSNHFGIHAVGHAVEPFCPGGYSDRGDHCQHIGHVPTDFDDDDIDDTYKVAGKLSMAMSTSESTSAAEERVMELDIGDMLPEEQLNNVIILGH